LGSSEAKNARHRLVWIRMVSTDGGGRGRGARRSRMLRRAWVAGCPGRAMCRESLVSTVVRLADRHRHTAHVAEESLVPTAVKLVDRRRPAAHVAGVLCDRSDAPAGPSSTSRSADGNAENRLKGHNQMQTAPWQSECALAETSSKPANFTLRAAEKPEFSLDAGNANLHFRSLPAAAKATDVLAAVAAMQRMQEAGITPSIACYGTLVGVSGKTGDVARAEFWLEALAHSSLGNPNVICVNMVMSACAKSGELDRAAAWFQRMPSLGVEPDVMTYNAVIDACARSGEVEQAEEWFGKMQDSGSIPNVVSFSSVLHTCARAGEATRAEAWLERMHAAGVAPNAICFNALIHACARADDTDRAAHRPDHMVKHRVQPTVTSYSTIIDRLSKSGDVSGARQLLTRMTESGVDADVIAYNKVLGACSGTGNVEAAQALFNQMREKGIAPNVVAFNLMLNIHARLGDTAAAQRLLMEMRLSGISADQVSFNTAFKSFSRSGDVFGASMLVDEIKAHGVELDAGSYTAIIAVCARAKNSEAAEHWFAGPGRVSAASADRTGDNYAAKDSGWCCSWSGPTPANPSLSRGRVSAVASANPGLGQGRVSAAAVKGSTLASRNRSGERQDGTPVPVAGVASDIDSTETDSTQRAPAVEAAKRGMVLPRQNPDSVEVLGRRACAQEQMSRQLSLRRPQLSMGDSCILSVVDNPARDKNSLCRGLTTAAEPALASGGRFPMADVDRGRCTQEQMSDQLNLRLQQPAMADLCNPGVALHDATVAKQPAASSRCLTPAGRFPVADVDRGCCTQEQMSEQLNLRQQQPATAVCCNSGARENLTPDENALLQHILGSADFPRKHTTAEAAENASALDAGCTTMWTMEDKSHGCSGPCWQPKRRKPVMEGANHPPDAREAPAVNQAVGKLQLQQGACPACKQFYPGSRCILCREQRSRCSCALEGLEPSFPGHCGACGSTNFTCQVKAHSKCIVECKNRTERVCDDCQASRCCTCGAVQALGFSDSVLRLTGTLTRDAGSCDSRLAQKSTPQPRDQPGKRRPGHKGRGRQQNPNATRRTHRCTLAHSGSNASSWTKTSTTTASSSLAGELPWWLEL